VQIREVVATVMVTGATGRQGGAVTRHLLEAGFGVRALVRDPQTPRAGALAERGIELAQGDLENRDSIQRAVEGAYGVFSMQNFFQAGSGGQVSFPGVTASLMVNSIISKRIAALPTGGCCGGIEKIYPDTEDY